ncbi:MAG: YHYH protein [Myxococcales bacterium]|nr:YHYH protein [Myxococcales bacterium]MCB9756209.1 YHYH protein [Myxococcales bacterium]
MTTSTLPRRAGTTALLALASALACSGGDGETGETGETAGEDITGVVFTRRSSDCADYVNDYTATARDIQRDQEFAATVSVSQDGSQCVFESNTIPNHDFDDATASFATPVAEVPRTLSIPRNPSAAAAPTGLTLDSLDAVMLNGVVVDLFSAGCWNVGDGFIGCFELNTPWRKDPMHPSNTFGADAHHAHTQPDGTYHYHGDPVAMWDESPGDNGSPVIGFAADGFPIYGGYFNDGGNLRRAVSGYTLKPGTRPSGADGPGGAYDGTYIDDFEFTGAGDLDECNGMTVDGQYGYYVTDAYPWLLRCFHGTPDPSFKKMMGAP